MRNAVKMIDDVALPEEEIGGAEVFRASRIAKRDRERKPWSKESNPHSVKPFTPDWASDKTLLPKRPTGKK